MERQFVLVDSAPFPVLVTDISWLNAWHTLYLQSLSSERAVCHKLTDKLSFLRHNLIFSFSEYLPYTLCLVQPHFHSARVRHFFHVAPAGYLRMCATEKNLLNTYCLQPVQ